MCKGGGTATCTDAAPACVLRTSEGVPLSSAPSENGRRAPPTRGATSAHWGTATPARPRADTAAAGLDDAQRLALCRASEETPRDEAARDEVAETGARETRSAARVHSRWDMMDSVRAEVVVCSTTATLDLENDDEIFWDRFWEIEDDALLLLYIYM